MSQFRSSGASFQHKYCLSRYRHSHYKDKMIIWGLFQYKDVVLQYRDPMIKIRRSCDHLIFNMEIPMPGKDCLYIEMGPRPSYFHNGSSYTVMMAFLYQSNPLIVVYKIISVMIFSAGCVVLNLHSSHKLKWLFGSNMKIRLTKINIHIKHSINYIHDNRVKLEIRQLHKICRF